jgi:hypothetical protein
MILGVSKGNVIVKEDKLYKLIYKSRIKKSNVFKLILEEDDIKVGE